MSERIRGSYDNAVYKSTYTLLTLLYHIPRNYILRENTPPRNDTNITRRRCGASVILEAWHKCQYLLTNSATYYI